ncbi:MAG: hypothetical protein ABI977_23005, partial [Acidobacteriota bacterium]
AMKYELDLIMPAGIPTWFIARQHRFTTHTHWKYGVLFKDEAGKHFGLVRALPTAKQVWLTVRGPAPHYFFSVLRDGLELTLNRFKAMQCKRIIPCRGHNEKPCAEEFELDDLTGFIEANPPLLQIQCRKGRTNVSVPDLLVGIRPETTMARLDEILGIVSRTDERVVSLQATVQQDFTRLFNAQQKDVDANCPNVFALRDWSGGGDITGLLEPIRSASLIGKFRDTVWKRRVEMQLYCQAPGQWHPVGYERGKHDPDSGLYQVEIDSELLRTIGPYLIKLAKVMKYVLPVVGVAMPWIVDAEQYKKQFKEDIDRWTKFADSAAKSIPELFDESQASKLGGDFHLRNARITEGYELRALRLLLKEKDSKDRWGRLNKWQTKEGNWLWLCPDHWAEYKD